MPSLVSREILQDLENSRTLNYLLSSLYKRRNEAVQEMLGLDIALEEGRFGAVKLQAEIATIGRTFELLDSIVAEAEREEEDNGHG